MTRDQENRRNIRQAKRAERAYSPKSAFLWHAGLGASLPLFFGASTTAIYKHIKRYHKAKRKWKSANTFNKARVFKENPDAYRYYRMNKDNKEKIKKLFNKLGKTTPREGWHDDFLFTSQGKARGFNRSGLNKILADVTNWKNIGRESAIYGTVLGAYGYRKERRRRK